MALRWLLLATTALCLSSDVDLHAMARSIADSNDSVVSRKPEAPTKALKSFRTEKELRHFLRDIAAERRKEEERRQKALAKEWRAEAKKWGIEIGPDVLVETVTVSGMSPPVEPVTNVQHAGVDEGGIVKLHGEYLVVLRRGRLFTIAVGAGQLDPVHVVDAFGPGIDPEHTWYDELIVYRDTVVVVGFSYERGGTELGLFDIDGAGHLSHRATYHFRSSDYFSGSNYTSRLIGSMLHFYATLPISKEVANPLDVLPALRQWRSGSTAADFRRIAPAGRVFKAATVPVSSERLVLHTLTSCDLAAPVFDCQASVLVADPLDVFYASPTAAYAWTTSATSNPERQDSILYRLPFDQSSVTAARVTGAPMDQLSFLESDDSHLNVLVNNGGTVTLLRLPLDALADGSQAIQSSCYRPLVQIEGWLSANRFVGSYVLFGTLRESGRVAAPGGLYAARWRGDRLYRLEVPHLVERIEPVGDSAVAIGSSGVDLHVTAIDLAGHASLAGRFVRPDSAQSESRSHAFFYHPEGAREGMFGLPIARDVERGNGSLYEESAAVMFLRNRALSFTPIGELEASSEPAVDDLCRASCVDWYGNARPLFFDGRVIALLGYELVEGQLVGDRIDERRRVSFAPR